MYTGNFVWNTIEDDLRSYPRVYWVLFDHDHFDHPELDAFASLLRENIDSFDHEQLRAWKTVAAFVAAQSVVMGSYKLEKTKNSGL